MSSKSFRFHPEAREEFREAVRWYRGRDFLVSTEFRISVSSSIQEIVQAPRRWPNYLYETRRYVLHRFPFSIVYLDEVDFVTIIAVAHSKRKPGYWKQRL
jgi:plasmid stabilization system protein ParE